ncbi:MAG: hypothetical protein Q7R94_00915 [bacterium]|nr:hypothetical protein [bacterium]
MWKKVVKFRSISFIFLTSFLLIAGGCLWAYIVLHNSSVPLILHFNDMGINQIGSFWEILWIGITGIVMAIINFGIALELEERDWFWGKVLAAGTLLLGVLIFAGLAAIISVN